MRVYWFVVMRVYWFVAGLHFHTVWTIQNVEKQYDTHRYGTSENGACLGVSRTNLNSARIVVLCCQIDCAAPLRARVFGRKLNA